MDPIPEAQMPSVPPPKFILILVFALTSAVANAQIQDWPDDEREGIKINYTEANVPRYTLPDPLMLLNGGKVTGNYAAF